MKIAAVFLATCLVAWQIKAKTIYDELEKDMQQDDLSSLLHSIQDEVKEINNDITSKDSENAHDNMKTEYWINMRNGYHHKEQKFNGDNDDDDETSDDERKRAVGVNITPWPKNAFDELIIPYTIDASIIPGSLKHTRLLSFIGQMNNLIRCNANAWRPRTTEAEYVVFQDSTGCSSFVGKVTNQQPQPINLADGCVLNNDGTVLHEMMHAMGFFHEHQRSDRDSFVTINSENIMAGRENNFVQLNTQSFNTPYDYGSVMHYGRTFFSANGQDTITPLQSGVTIGQRNGPSPTDILQINRLYGCPEETTTTTTTPTTTTTTTSTTTTTTPTTTTTTITTPTTTTTTTPSTTTTTPTTTTTTPTTTTTTTTTPTTTSTTTGPTAPSTGILLGSCDYERRKYGCRYNQFRIVNDRNNRYLTYSPSSRCVEYSRSSRGWLGRRRTCVRRRSRNGFVSLTAFVIRSNLPALNCTCSRRECSDKKYCVSFSYRRRGVQTPPITSVEVSLYARCVKTSDYQCVNATVDLTPTNTFNTHHVEFHSKCATSFQARIKTMKGGDTVDIDNFKLTTDACPVQSKDTESYNAEPKREVLKERLMDIQSKLQTVRDTLVKLG
ncbi:zinc metalloproteinase nas-32-like [Hydractinia symbiolongicarpus]|uniref:zinc metalloproteinase nas-32-like n=1 Tax=Hydractinia symbiolongicarpus TaxID=13093 RepID=UPI00254B860A|nr:zinc metalloproteinase nas-32-like [Hydractinia symbiolongicarpus]